jgi:trk system potassium uptake protein TrkA
MLQPSVFSLKKECSPVAQQILIVGLGQFGMSLAHALSDKGAEVLAVDRRKDLVEEASSFVTEALVMNATDEAELARLHPGQRDVAVCAIGDDSKEASIICTALLRQMGAPWIISRANDAMHQRILHLVGAHQVVNPEQEFGKRFANRLVYRNVVADMPFGEDLHITEIKILPTMIGKTLMELALPKRFGVMVVAIRRGTTGKILQPTPNAPLQEGDNLVIVSHESAIPKLSEEF